MGNLRHKIGTPALLPARWPTLEWVLMFKRQIRKKHGLLDLPEILGHQLQLNAQRTRQPTSHIEAGAPSAWLGDGIIHRTRGSLRRSDQSQR